MPIPTPNPNEKRHEFVIRCMTDDKMLSEYPDATQRYAICTREFTQYTK